MQRIHNYREAGLFVSNYKSLPSPAFFCVKKKAIYLEYRNILHQKFSSAAKEELNELISTNSISPRLRHRVYRNSLPPLYLPQVREWFHPSAGVWAKGMNHLWSCSPRVVPLPMGYRANLHTPQTECPPFDGWQQCRWIPSQITSSNQLWLQFWSRICSWSK